MPRTARRKDPGGIYHVMGRSLTEIDLFQSDEDKEYFLDLLKRYKDKTKSKILGYCLMTNHYHIHVDPCGYDISKFMQCLNLAYVRYINRKYKRKGPLFDDRFNSKIINSDNYNLVVSAYIHLNPKDIKGYRGKEFDYPYSSMGIYLGKNKDNRGIIDSDFLLSCINEKYKKKAIRTYVEFICDTRNDGIDLKIEKYEKEFENGKFHYIIPLMIFMEIIIIKECITKVKLLILFYCNLTRFFTTIRAIIIFGTYFLLTLKTFFRFIKNDPCNN